MDGQLCPAGQGTGAAIYNVPLGGSRTPVTTASPKATLVGPRQSLRVVLVPVAICSQFQVSHVHSNSSLLSSQL